MTDLLKLESVTLKFGGLTALSGVSMSVPSFGIHGIIGPNGAGKSTLFNLVTGLYQPHEGRVLFDGQEIQNRSTIEIAGLGISRTFQNIRLLPHLSVLDNLRVVTAAQRKGTFWKCLLNPGSDRELGQITRKAEEVLNRVGLQKVKEEFPTSLPYGDQRKLEIARALMRSPKLLLLDEPAAGMNPVEKENLAVILRRILEEKIVILVIEHDMKFIMNLCENITVLSQGAVCASGAPDKIQSDPLVVATYLGNRAIGKYL